MPKYLIETISVFRLRYVVEAEEESHALDEVTMNEGEGHLREFSQKHIAENITSSRELTDEEYIALFNRDNDYLVGWTNAQKFDSINRVNYDT